MTYPTFFNLTQEQMAEGYQIATAAAEEFQFLAFCFIAENILLGITQTNKGPMIAEALQPVVFYGNNGALWEALGELEQIIITPEMSPYLTEARVNWMKNQILAIIASL